MYNTTQNLANAICASVIYALEQAQLGHPEYADTSGFETTTSPLAQIFDNSIEMAIAKKLLVTTCYRSNLSLVHHYTHALGDNGCLMKGLSLGVYSLSNKFGLGILIDFYDDNVIAIDGRLESFVADDTYARFKSDNCQVIDQTDGHNSLAFQATDLFSQL